MQHELFGSVEAILAPDALASITGHRAVDVRLQPLETPAGVSGSRLSRVDIVDERGDTARYILKRISSAWDWIMRATDNSCGREAAIWRHGILDRLPPATTHTVIACAHDGPGWALLMRDAGPSLITSDPLTPLSAGDSDHLLDALAALHAAFWQPVDLRASGVCWSDLRSRYMLLAPATARRERGAHEELSNVLDGWDAFPAVAEPDVVALIQTLHDDLGPLCAALGRYPHTLIHGDYKLANLGIQRGDHPRVILLDWASVGIAPPSVDLAWYLGLASLRLPISKDEAIDVYRRRLALRLGGDFDPAWWQPQLSLGLLGGLLCFGYWLAWLASRHPRDDLRSWAQGELRWWSTHARAGASLL